MSARVLTLREYESARIGDRWDAAERVVPPRVAAALDRLQADTRERVFDVSRRSVRALNFVGTVCAAGHSIDVLPKIDRSDTRTRSNLFAMLQVAGFVPTVPTGVSSQADADVSFLEILLRLYIENLTMEWRRGHVAGFLRVERNRPHLRGKLHVTEHVRANLHSPWRLFTGADEFVEDVSVSRLLKAALQACRRYATTEPTRQAAVRLLAEFEEVSDVVLTSEERERLGTDRQSARFGPLVELAKLILGGHTPDQFEGRETYSLIFDMNVVFERLIGNLLQKHVCHPGTVVRLQVGGRALLRQDTAGRFWLRPDVGIFKGGQPICLLDTKWKRLDPARPYAGVSQVDMYQMYAYGKEHRAPTVVALYPRVEDFGADVAVYRHQPGDSAAPKIVISTVDVGARLLVDETGRPSVRAQLNELVRTVLGSADSDGHIR